MTRNERRIDPAGLVYAIAAYGAWGFLALYFKAIKSVPPLEILAHRIVWSVAMLLVLATLLRRWQPIAETLRARRTLLLLSASTVLIAANWFLFIWAVTTGHVLEASLGYFINPLVSVVLGRLFLGEHLRRIEWASVAIAAIAVLWLSFSVGVVPSLSLLLALTFGFYGFVRKRAHVSSIDGLLVETVFLLPLALGFLVWRAHEGDIAFGARSRELDLLLLAAGPLTAVPLIWFASAVRRLRLAMIGILQYISPTIQFLFAITVFHEPFDHRRLVAFVFIWIAVAIFTADNLRKRA